MKKILRGTNIEQGKIYRFLSYKNYVWNYSSLDIDLRHKCKSIGNIKMGDIYIALTNPVISTTFFQVKILGCNTEVLGWIDIVEDYGYFEEIIDDDSYES